MTKDVAGATVWLAALRAAPEGSVTVQVNLYVVPTVAPVTLRAKTTPGVFDSWVLAGIVVSA